MTAVDGNAPRTVTLTRRQWSLLCMLAQNGMAALAEEAKALPPEHPQHQQGLEVQAVVITLLSEVSSAAGLVWNGPGSNGFPLKEDEVRHGRD